MGTTIYDNAGKNHPRKKIIVINVIGNIPGGGVALFQSGYDPNFLKSRIASYLERKLGSMTNKSDILEIQNILHTQANKVKELLILNKDGTKLYDFESNQRIDELIALLTITASTNQLNKNRNKNIVLLPAWQRPRQSTAVKNYTGKESWDGFMHELVPIGEEDPSIGIPMIPIEIKSLMINPAKEKFSDLNNLLEQKTPKFSKHFQSEGSVCAVVVLPYSSDSNSNKLSFDLKEATDIINLNVSPGALGCLIFFSFENTGEGFTKVTVKCHFVSKNPQIDKNNKIASVDFFELTFGKFKS